MEGSKSLSMERASCGGAASDDVTGRTGGGGTVSRVGLWRPRNLDFLEVLLTFGGFGFSRSTRYTGKLEAA